MGEPVWLTCGACVRAHGLGASHKGHEACAVQICKCTLVEVIPLHEAQALHNASESGTWGVLVSQQQRTVH